MGLGSRFLLSFLAVNLLVSAVHGQAGKKKPVAAAAGGAANVDPKLGLVASQGLCPDGSPIDLRTRPGCGQNPVTGDIGGFEQQIAGGLGGSGRIPGGGGNFGGVGGSHHGGGGGNFGGAGGSGGHGGLGGGSGSGPGFGGSGGSFGNYGHCTGGSQCCCLSQSTCSATQDGGFPGLDLRIVNKTPHGITCQAGDIYCCSGSDLTGGDALDHPEYPIGTCGVQRNDYYKSPYGQADYGEYPWQVIILDAEDNFVGGGVLIDAGHVLTVTHKIYDYYSGNQAYRLKVRVGDWDVGGNNPEEKFPYQQREVAKIVIQDGFNKRLAHNNLAILYLKVPVEYNAVVGPICLPEYSVKSFDNHICWTTGWGKDAKGIGEYQAILKEVDLPILPPQACTELLGRALSRPGVPYIFNSRQHICAGGVAGKDACDGDGGSGLVCQNQYDKKFYLAGLVAFGHGCAKPDVPGGYMNILSNLDWIRRNTNYGGGFGGQGGNFGPGGQGGNFGPGGQGGNFGPGGGNFGGQGGNFGPGGGNFGGQGGNFGPGGGNFGGQGRPGGHGRPGGNFQGKR